MQQWGFMLLMLLIVAGRGLLWMVVGVPSRQIAGFLIGY
jgi:hypothetical protein